MYNLQLRINMSAFVLDYDHNAPSAEYLRDTHKNMFDAIRKSNSDLPIIMLSRPKYHLNDEEIHLLNMIKAT